MLLWYVNLNLCLVKKELISVATKSILKDVSIKEKNMGRAFVNALEQSSTYSTVRKVNNSKFATISKEDIKKIFGA